MTTFKTQTIQRVTAVGRFSDGDSDIAAQTAVLGQNYRIVAITTEGDGFQIVGEKENAVAIDDILFDRMGERRLMHLSFNYGLREIAAYDFDGELVAQSEYLERLFELAGAATAEGGNQ